MEEEHNEQQIADNGKQHPDGTTSVRIGNTKYIVSVFFNHDTDKTFVEKLKQIIKRKRE